MPMPLPEIPESECTPQVRQLLDVLLQSRNRMRELEDDILRLRNHRSRPIVAASPLETPARPPRDPEPKRPGSAKRPKTAQLTLTDEVVVPLPVHSNNRRYACTTTRRLHSPSRSCCDAHARSPVASLVTFNN